MATPDDRRYTKEHEWVKADGDTGRIGITDYAQDQLGDVVYVDLPQAGTALVQFEKMGEIESVKAVSDLFSPVSGDVIALNHALAEKPELVNADPYGEAWLVEVRLSDAAQIDGLMTAAQYEAFIAGEQQDEALGP